MHRKILQFLYVLFVCTSPCVAQLSILDTSNVIEYHSIQDVEAIVYSDKTEILSIGEKVSLLEDSTNSLGVHEVMTSGTFVPSNQKVPNLGLSNSSFWVLFKIKNLSGDTQLLLELSLPTIDEVTLFSILPNGGITHVTVGESLPFYTRKYKEPNYLFDLDIPNDEVRSFLIKVKSKEYIQLPLAIGSTLEVFGRIKYKDIFTGAYVGLMLTMIIYNLFIFFVVGDKNYLYYVIYVSSVLITQISIQGYPFQFLWPDSPWLQTHNMFIFPSLVGITFIEFSKKFLEMKERTPHLWKGIWFIEVSYIICFISAMLGFYTFSFNLINISAGFVSFYMLVTAVIIARKFKPARFYVLAWSAFLVGVIIYVLKDFGVIPYNEFSRYSMQVGSAFESVLLSFALADRINILQRDKEIAQSQALKFQTSALKAQMNPHFIFNSLNAIQSYIAQGDKAAANRYLSRFSKLIRAALEHSRLTKVLLEDDICSLENYLDLEQLRFQGSFDFTIHVAEEIDVAEVSIPPLLVQPFVENAIVHGLANKDGKGRIEIDYRLENGSLQITVTDNGIGIEESKKRKTGVNASHKSIGLTATKRRLDMLAGNGETGRVDIKDLKNGQGEVVGTCARIWIPLEV